MNKRKRIVLAIMIVIGLYAANNFYMPWMITGTYVYNYPWAVADGPNEGDQLTLKEDGTFESTTWGNGTYVIQGSSLKLVYTYSMGKALFTTRIYRAFLIGKPRFRVSSDLGYYFTKIN